MASLTNKIISIADVRRRFRPGGTTMAENFINRRQDARKPSEERLFVQITGSENPDLVGTTVSCRALDVSGSGLKIATTTQIPPGCTLDIWVDNTQRPGKYFLTSDVRWSTHHVDGQCQLGVRLHEGATTDIDEWRRAQA